MTFSEGGIVPGPRKAILRPGERVMTEREMKEHWARITTRAAQVFCCEDGCHEPATTSRPNGMAGDTPVVELVCEKHKHTDG